MASLLSLIPSSITDQFAQKALAGKAGNIGSLVSQARTGKATETPSDSPANIVEVSDRAKAVGDLQSLLDALNKSTDKASTLDALNRIGQYIDSNSAGSLDNALFDSLKNLLGKALDDVSQLGSDESYSLSIAFSFSGSASQGPDYESSGQEVSFSMSFSSEDLAFSANYSYLQGSYQGDGLSAQGSIEKLSFSMIATGDKTQAALDSVNTLASAIGETIGKAISSFLESSGGQNSTGISSLYFVQLTQSLYQTQQNIDITQTLLESLQENLAPKVTQDAISAA